MGRKKSKKQQSGLDELFNENVNIFYGEVSDDDVEYADDEDGPVDGIRYIRTSLVEPNADQPRKSFDDEKLSELADSIKELGIIQPIVVRKIPNGGYRIVAGERRWRAARLAGLESVPVIVRELEDKEAAQIALVENLQREDLDPIEEALGFSSLIETYGYTQQSAANAVGKSRSAISNSLRLLTLCAEVREMLKEGSISVGHAKLIVGESDDFQRLAAAKVVEDGLSVRQLEAYIASQKRTKTGPKKQPARNSFYTEAELALKQTFGYPVKIKSAKNGRTSITLSCKNEEEFRELMRKLTEV